MLVNFYGRACPAVIGKGEEKTKEKEARPSKSEKTFSFLSGV